LTPKRPCFCVLVAAVAIVYGCSDSSTAPGVRPVVAVIITPTASAVQAGQTVALTATTRDANGNTLVDRAVAWVVDDDSIATVDSNGVVTGVGPGVATVTASSEGRSGMVAISVSVDITGTWTGRVTAPAGRVSSTSWWSKTGRTG